MKIVAPQIPYTVPMTSVESPKTFSAAVLWQESTPGLHKYSENPRISLKFWAPGLT
jgi:hypothetical protein